MASNAFLGLGSNLGNPKENILRAIQQLSSLPNTKILNQSSLYRTEPIGNTNQNWFLNSVVQVQTNYSPRELLISLMALEKGMGRMRIEKWGPRIIDLDILYFDDLIINEEELQIPHPGISERCFVLVPLNEIAPDYIHPELKKSNRNLLGELSQEQQQVEKLD